MKNLKIVKIACFQSPTMGTKNWFLLLKMAEIDGLELKEQDKYENHCVLQHFCLGLFERDAFILDQCAGLGILTLNW